MTTLTDINAPPNLELESSSLHAPNRFDVIAIGWHRLGESGSSSRHRSTAAEKFSMSLPDSCVSRT
jgi:hypothetical protein